MRQKTSLPNGCWCSRLSVYPSNWKTAKASIAEKWYITYRFHDPNREKPKQVMIKGMNDFRTLAERRQIVRTLLDNEMDMLLNEGYNPFERDFIAPIRTSYEIDPSTHFPKALKMALDKIRCTVETRRDITTIIKYVSRSIEELHIQTVRICDVKKRHIRAVLDHLASTKQNWSSNQFNHYRKYLSVLFSELSELDAVEYNPVLHISKQRTITRIRQVLTMDERKRVNDHLRENHYHFWRFTQVFFHSGAREAELFRIKFEDVNLDRQEFKVTILKGREQSEKLRPIKTVILDLWKEIISECGPGQYLFSDQLVPGDKMINPRQVTRRWRVHVKDKLGIKADFYSLKHSNLDETAAALSIGDAAGMAGHSTPVVTLKYYAHGEEQRQLEKLKKVNNKFC